MSNGHSVWDKTEVLVGVIALVSSIFGGFVSKLVSFTKDRAQLVTKKELKEALLEYARKDSVTELKEVVQGGFARMERLYAQDRELSQERELAFIERIERKLK